MKYLKQSVVIYTRYLIYIHYVLDRSCEQDWTYYSGSCYYRDEILKTYNASLVDCESRQANLVTVNDINEQNFLRILLEDHGAWNGFNRLNNTKNTFEWVSGEKVEFTNWNTGEPNKRYRCVHMKYNYQHKWHTEPCLTKQKYVCEKGLFSFFFF